MKITQIIKDIVDTKSACMIRKRNGEHVKGSDYEYDVKPLLTGNKRKGWIILDLTTANAMLTVYNAIKPENQAKFNQLHVLTLVDFTWKHCS
jgi:hypothetical protein